MAFLKLPAADVASDAFEKIRSSALDGKPLFVKLLPNIYVSEYSGIFYAWFNKR